jgi:hypothetical protein
MNAVLSPATTSTFLDGTGDPSRGPTPFIDFPSKIGL